MRSAIMVGEIGPIRHYVKFVEPVSHFVSMIMAIFIDYILNIACYHYFKLL